jgi:hypothetical protein
MKEKETKKYVDDFKLCTLFFFFACLLLELLLLDDFEFTFLGFVSIKSSSSSIFNAANLEGTVVIGADFE